MGHKSLDNAGESVSEEGGWIRFRYSKSSLDASRCGRWSAQAPRAPSIARTTRRPAFESRSRLTAAWCRAARWTISVLLIKTIALADPFQITYMSGGMTWGSGSSPWSGWQRGGDPPGSASRTGCREASPRSTDWRSARGWRARWHSLHRAGLVDGPTKRQRAPADGGPPSRQAVGRLRERVESAAL